MAFQAVKRFGSLILSELSDKNESECLKHKICICTFTGSSP